MLAGNFGGPVGLDPEIVGDRPDRAPLLGDLQAQASALGLGDRFVFAGFRRDIARTLSAFDLVVFPSLWEGTPLTVFETLAMGKPVVATAASVAGLAAPSSGPE